MRINDYDRIKCVIFDLDGTIYFGSELADKAHEVIAAARSKFENIFFITNNSNQTRKRVHERLLALNVDAKLEEVVNTAYAAAKYLQDNDFKEVYCLGTKALEQEISEFGIIVDSEKPEAIVVGYDIDFSLQKLEKALNVFHEDCKIIVASKERTYPRGNGIMSPGAGPIAAAFEHTVNKTCDLVIGKPNSFMLDLMIEGLNIQPSEILVIGDIYEIDIQMAEQFGAKSILISNKDETKYDCITVENLKDVLEIW